MGHNGGTGPLGEELRGAAAERQLSLTATRARGASWKRFLDEATTFRDLGLETLIGLVEAFELFNFNFAKSGMVNFQLKALLDGTSLEMRTQLGFADRFKSEEKKFLGLYSKGLSVLPGCACMPVCLYSTCVFVCICICTVHRYVHAYLSMYVCMYVCIYACKYVHMYVHMYVYMYVCVHVCKYVCLCGCLCLCMCVYVRMYVHVYLCLPACMHA